MSNLPVSTPKATSETQPFWDATARGVVLLPRCNDCDIVIWYPRRFCPLCASRSVTWFEASGLGTIYSYTLITKGGGRFRDVGPFVFAYVELAEGPRIMTNIVECDPAALSIGQRVRAVFDDTGEGSALLRFAPLS